MMNWEATREKTFRNSETMWVGWFEENNLGPPGIATSKSVFQNLKPDLTFCLDPSFFLSFRCRSQVEPKCHQLVISKAYFLRKGLRLFGNGQSQSQHRILGRIRCAPWTKLETCLNPSRTELSNGGTSESSTRTKKRYRDVEKKNIVFIHIIDHEHSWTICKDIFNQTL